MIVVTFLNGLSFYMVSFIFIAVKTLFYAHSSNSRTPKLNPNQYSHIDQAHNHEGSFRESVAFKYQSKDLAGNRNLSYLLDGIVRSIGSS
jgi:hypothetical protein